MTLLMNKSGDYFPLCSMFLHYALKFVNALFLEFNCKNVLILHISDEERMVRLFETGFWVRNEYGFKVIWFRGIMRYLYSCVQELRRLIHHSYRSRHQHPNPFYI